MASLKRKLERYKSKEWTSASDEVLLEEIRTYKVEYTHPLEIKCIMQSSLPGQAELSML